MSKKYYCFIDIEGTGEQMNNNPIFAIGAAVLEVTYPIKNLEPPKFVDEFRAALAVTEKDFNDRILKEFWHSSDELKKLKQLLMQQGIDRKVGLLKFIDWLKTLYIKYVPSTLILVSDNKVYDLGSLNHELANYLNEVTLFHISATCTYCSDLDLSDWVYGIALGAKLIPADGTEFGTTKMEKFLEQKLGVKYHYAHTHDPLDDAKHDAEVFWYTLFWLNC